MLDNKLTNRLIFVACLYVIISLIVSVMSCPYLFMQSEENKILKNTEMLVFEINSY